MRILIAGAGGIGGYFGARLLAAGRGVHFLVRPARAERLAERGLRVHSPHGDIWIEHPFTVTADAIDVPFDLVLLACKAYDLEDMLDAMAPAVGDHTLVLPLLNGMAHLDALDRRFGAERVLGGLCVIAATLDQAGEVRHLNQTHQLTFGAREGTDRARLAEVAAALGDAGFDMRASDDIVQDMWDKWVFLASLAAGTCMLRAPVGTIVAVPGGKDILLGLLDAVRSIAAAHGHAPGDATLVRARATLTEAGSPLTASMLRDLEAGGRTEADHVIGDLIARADGPVDPLLRTAYAHLKAYEAGRDAD